MRLKAPSNLPLIVCLGTHSVDVSLGIKEMDLAGEVCAPTSHFLLFL